MTGLRAGAATDRGLVRGSNEDRVLISSLVYAVADGMGGHAGGEVASALAVARLGLLGGREALAPEELRAHLLAVNDEIVATGRGEPRLRGLGTTIAGLGLVTVAGARHWAVFHVGDCRVYRLVQGVLELLTNDHTEVAELVAAGELDEAAARTHPRRHVVTRALGTEPGPEVDLWVLPPTPGERFLVCSDGLPLEVGVEQIAAVLREVAAPQDAADALVRTALAGGGRDNVSALVLDGPVDGPAVRPGDGAGGDGDAGDTLPRDPGPRGVAR